MSTVISLWLPALMKEREESHLSEAGGQFSALKASIDNLLLQRSQTLVVTAPVTLGVEGFALFVSPSFGSLSVKPLSTRWTVNTEDGAVDPFGGVNSSTGGTVQYDTRNQYAVQQTLSLENNAIVAAQSGGEVVRSGPQFRLENRSGVMTLSITLVYVVGENSSIAGTESRGVRLRLVYYSENSYSWSPGKLLYINITTSYPLAWSDYFNSTLRSAGFSIPADYNVVRNGQTVTLSLTSIRVCTIGRGAVEATLGG